MAETIESYIHLAISTAARGIKQQTVDTPLLLGYHTKWAEYTRTYTSLSGLISDGFAVTDPIYLMALALLSQDRKVSQFKVGRRATAFTHAVVLTVDADTGTIAVTISKGGTSRTYTQTGGAGGIPAEAIALALQMNNDADGWGSGGTAELTIAANGNDVELDAASPANDGELWYYSSLSQISLDDATVDPGLAADLAAIQAVDDDWYAVSLDSCSGEEGEELADALQASEKLVGAACQDTDCATGGGLLAALNTAAYGRAFGLYSPHSMAEYPACAWLGEGLPYPPGSLDWMFRTLQGPTAADLTAAQIAAIKAVYGNMYVQVVRDAGITQEAVVANGDYIDIVVLKDYLTFRIREAVWDFLRAGPKVPYTDKGARGLGQVIKQVLKSAQNNAKNAGGDALELVDSDGRSTFDFDFTPTADQDPTDRANRVFRGLTWRAVLSGSVRAVYITGELV